MPAATVVHHRWSDIQSEAITPFIARRYITGERITIARFELRRGGIVPRHSHEPEQISYVVTGRLKFVLNAQELVVGAGEVVQIPSRVEHEVQVLEDAEVLDMFSSVRQDWLDKTDHYFGRTQSTQR